MIPYLPHIAGLVTLALLAIVRIAVHSPAGWEDGTGFHLGDEGLRDRQADLPRREVESVPVHGLENDR